MAGRPGRTAAARLSLRLGRGQRRCLFGGWRRVADGRCGLTVALAPGGFAGLLQRAGKSPRRASPFMVAPRNALELNRLTRAVLLVPRTGRRLAHPVGSNSGGRKRYGRSATEAPRSPTSGKTTVGQHGGAALATGAAFFLPGLAAPASPDIGRSRPALVWPGKLACLSPPGGRVTAAVVSSSTAAPDSWASGAFLPRLLCTQQRTRAARRGGTRRAAAHRRSLPPQAWTTTTTVSNPPRPPEGQSAQSKIRKT